MAAITTSWMMGSFYLAANATIVVGGNNVVIPAGYYYGYDATTNSLVTTIQTGIAAVYAGSTVAFLKNRKIKCDFNGNSVTLVIPTALQEVLGFTSSPYGAATSRTAENVSTLLWSAATPETTTYSPVGVAGRKVHDRVMKASPTGLSFKVTRHSSTTLADWNWFAVPQARGWTPSEAPGEYTVFFEGVIVPGLRMKLYSQMTEDDDSTDPVTWVDPLGPYTVPRPNYDWYVRFVNNTDSVGSNIEIKAMLTSEYS